MNHTIKSLTRPFLIARFLTSGLVALISIVTVFGLLGLGVGNPCQGAEVIAVCPAPFRAALKPWIAHRQSQRVSVQVIDSQSDAKSLHEAIKMAAGPETKYIVLCGDSPVIGTIANPARDVPTFYRRTSVTANWGSTPTFATDMPYGDVDADGVPDAAVGRMPVQRENDLSRLVGRIIAYENSDDFGPWRGQVQLVGGIGGFGMMADAAIESVTRTVVTSVLPAETKTNVAYASPGHLFYPAGDSFTDAVVDQFAAGSRFWVYAGHGQVTELDRVPQTRDGIPVLDPQSVKRLNRPAKAAPIALLLACYTGAIDAAEDSLAERMLLTDGGPIAVIAGSRMTMPYGNTTAAVGLIKGVYTEQLPRLGNAWLSALKQMHAGDSKEKATSRIMIDAVAKLVSPAGTKLIDERHEHMGLYNLLGDPTLKLQHPAAAKIDVASGFDFGETIEINVASPIAGDLTLSVDRPLGAVTKGNPNATTVASITSAVEANVTSMHRIALPTGVSGPLTIRAIVSGSDQWATAAAKTNVRPKR
jgi:hypothetical protein